jgi:hypothetical protein
VIDIDAQETYVLQAFNDELGMVDSMTRSYSDPDAGNVTPTLMSVEAADIDYIVLDGSQPDPPQAGGYAVDDLQYKSICDDDEDTYIDNSCGGDDCDDSDAEVNPGMTEIEDNGKDDDCDPSTPSWGTPASTMDTKHEISSSVANYLLLLCAPIGAMLVWKGLRRRS